MKRKKSKSKSEKKSKHLRIDSLYVAGKYAPTQSCVIFVVHCDSLYCFVPFFFVCFVYGLTKFVFVLIKKETEKYHSIIFQNKEKN